jgi:gliding motility-associated-like protein
LVLGTVVVAAPIGANYEYSNGGIYQSSPTFSNLASGTYSITVKDTTTDCISSATSVIVNAIPAPTVPLFNPIPPICYGAIISLPLISTNGFSGTWLPLFDPTTTTTYTFTPDPGQCSSTTTLQIMVLTNPTVIATPATDSICSGDSTNIVLTSSLIGTTFSWTVNSIRVSGATNDSGSSIIQALETTGNTLGTVVYTVTPKLNSCSGLAITIPVEVKPLPLPTLTPGVICVDAAGITFNTYILDSGLSSTDYTFQWSINSDPQSGVGNTFEALVAGNYSVIATNVLTGCVSTPAFSDVTPSFPATGFTAEVTSLFFSENGTITATVTGGNGTYLFALDDGALQTSNVFENVALGEHTVSVTDTNGCTNLLPVTLNIIGYPTYFTPNGDGIHDTWNIVGLENQPTAKVYVFDRYGKLIKQINSKSSGWDGTYNGTPMPSADYWFTIDYLELGAKEFKANFSLKR